MQNRSWHRACKMCSFLIIYVFFFISISMPAQAAGQRDFAAGMIERYATKGDEENTDISSSWIDRNNSGIYDGNINQ